LTQILELIDFAYAGVIVCLAEFYALFGGGVKDPGWDDTPEHSRARLAIVPGYTHYNFGQGPDIARVFEGYLTHPTSKATQFSPE
jgi:hypothetical protein